MKKLFKISITGGLTFLIALLFLMIQLPKTTVYAAEISKIAVTFDEPKAGDSATAVPKLKYDGDFTATWTGYYTIDDTNNTYTGTFEAGKSYLASITVEAPDGTSIAADGKYTVNGAKLYSLLEDHDNTLNTYITMSYGDHYAAMLVYTFTVPKSGGSDDVKAPSLKVKAAKSTLKYSKKQQTVKLTVTTNSKGKISYSAASTTKKLKKYVSVSSKGIVTLKKGAPKGSYKIKVSVAANGNYKSASKTITIKVK